MSVIEEVRGEREDLARVLKKHAGIRRIVEDLYPDSAHFIFELLQNAEDTGATGAEFVLDQTTLAFEHNGRAFEEQDVYAITDIGEGTKAGADDKIGRFGVGFKAVFAYSETPHIWSTTFSFKITELVLPTALPPRNLGGRTRFEFPFNNPKKPPAVAFAEVRDGLAGLAETTLLFLPKLEFVGWRIAGGLDGEIKRVQHSACHVEVIKIRARKLASRSHFLKFDEAVRDLPKQRVAIAYALDFLPEVKSFADNKELAKQLKIVPAAPGRVAVFFPAEKETSGLRFHLHAPFVPELSRASIKETPANLPLFEQLAALAATSLHRVRDLALLTAEFLEVLPNARDELDGRYGQIRDAIVTEMRDQPLTPTHAKGHAPARNLVQGKAALKSLLDDEDLRSLIDHEDGNEPPRWVTGVAQKNSNADRLLETLGVREWGIDDLVTLLCHKASASGADGGVPFDITPTAVMDWLGTMSAQWHQKLYAILFEEYLPSTFHKEQRASTLGGLRIVRLASGGHGVAEETFFGGDGIAPDALLRLVDPGTYSTGKSETEKDNARAFLRAIGVRDVGEAELVEMILKTRYTAGSNRPDEETYRNDLLRFVELVAAQPERCELFGRYNIFECADGVWRTPDSLFIDLPYRDTKLAAYYAARGVFADRFGLALSYQQRGIDAGRLVKFAIALGAVEHLRIEETTCERNPHRQQLQWVKPINRSRFRVDKDHHIPGLDRLLAKPTPDLSKLIWKTLVNQSDDAWTKARFQYNSNSPPQTALSQLVSLLRDAAWVSQTDGRFVRPAEAARDRLPGGFPFDPAWDWLTAIHFGRDATGAIDSQLQRETLARELGFDDNDALERAQRFAALPAARQREILSEWEYRANLELPERESSNPTLRAERVAEQAVEAPERRTEARTRSVSVNRDGVKQEAGEYLCQQYTTDGEMICQACRGRLPFKLADGSDYFERVEFLCGLKRHHKQNYLALCPNHAAMVRYANGSTDELTRLVTEAVGNKVTVVLAEREVALHFTRAHLIDLKAVIAADADDPEPIALIPVTADL